MNPWAEICERLQRWIIRLITCHLSLITFYGISVGLFKLHPGPDNMDNDRPLSDNSLALWSWLVPITYLIHIAEEFWGGEGYSAYLKRLRGVELSPTRFLVGQAIGLALIIVGIFIARRLNFPRQLLVILGTVVLVNGLSHLGTSLFYHEYGPGLVTGVLIWIPFGVATLFRLKGSMNTGRYWLYVAIGIAINATIAVITLKGGRAS